MCYVKGQIQDFKTYGNPLSVLCIVVRVHYQHTVPALLRASDVRDLRPLVQTVVYYQAIRTIMMH